MPKQFCREELDEQVDAPLLCPTKKIKCCPKFNKKCCPVHFDQFSVVGDRVRVVIQNDSKAPLLPFLRFSVGPVAKDDCTISSGNATILGYRERADDNGYDVLVRLNDGLDACGGDVDIQFTCPSIQADTTMEACIECFCPDLAVVAKCRSIVSICRKRALSTPRGIGCCVPICKETVAQLGP